MRLPSAPAPKVGVAVGAAVMLAAFWYVTGFWLPPCLRACRSQAISLDGVWLIVVVGGVLVFAGSVVGVSGVRYRRIATVGGDGILVAAPSRKSTLISWEGKLTSFQVSDWRSRPASRGYPGLFLQSSSPLLLAWFEGTTPEQLEAQAKSKGWSVKAKSEPKVWHGLHWSESTYTFVRPG